MGTASGAAPAAHGGLGTFNFSGGRWCGLIALCGLAQAAAAAESPEQRPIRPIVEMRMRFEGVQQDPLPSDAEALTMRARLGFESAKRWSTSALVEGDFIWPLNDRYSRPGFPLVADPEGYEINRLQLTNSAIPATVVTLGRQRISLDDQRFVGPVGWRQNEQTFDAVRVVTSPLRNWTFDLAYLDQVNRVVGKDSLLGRYQGDMYLFNASYAAAIGRLAGFAYLLDLDLVPGAPAPARFALRTESSATLGLRFSGERALGAGKIAYVASYATQREHGNNPLDFEVDYSLLELTFSRRPFSAGLGYEVLEGDGVKGFATPLASYHIFQGWVDKFAGITPPDGIVDAYATLGLEFKPLGTVDALSAALVYHDLAAQRGGRSYGSEVDLQLKLKLRRFVTTLKYGDYQEDGFATDTRKIWFQVDYAL